MRALLWRLRTQGVVLVLTFAAVSGALASPVLARADVAPSAADTADLQCLGVFMYLAGQEQDDERRNWFNGGVKHHLGRLQARTPDVDWLSRLTDYFVGPFRSEFEANKDRCGNGQIAQDDALQAWGDAFQARVEAAAAAAPKP